MAKKQNNFLKLINTVYVEVKKKTFLSVKLIIHEKSILLEYQNQRIMKELTFKKTTYLVLYFLSPFYLCYEFHFM